MLQTSGSTFQPKKILISMDFSVSSIAALAAAKQLAQRFCSELYLIHVIPMLPMVTGIMFEVNVIEGGLDIGAKKQMIASLTQAVRKYVSIPPEERSPMFMLIRDGSARNWGMFGKLAKENAHPYKVGASGGGEGY